MKKYFLLTIFIFLAGAFALFAQAQTLPTCPAGQSPTATIGSDGVTITGYTCQTTGGGTPTTGLVVNPVSTPAGGAGSGAGTAPVNNSGCPSGGTMGANGVCNLGYTPLEPIPGVTSGTNLTSGAGFSNLINALFKILISAGALIAVLSLTIGGIQYMTSSSIGNKTQGLDRARAAIYGLLIIAATWLILNTINPHLLNFNFVACPPGNATCSATAIVNNNLSGTTAVLGATQQVALTQDQINQAGFAGKTQDNSALIYNSTNLPPASAVQNYSNTCQAKGGVPTGTTISGQSAFVCETQAAFNSSDQLNNAGAPLP